MAIAGAASISNACEKLGMKNWPSRSEKLAHTRNKSATPSNTTNSDFFVLRGSLPSWCANRPLYIAWRTLWNRLAMPAASGCRPIAGILVTFGPCLRCASQGKHWQVLLKVERININKPGTRVASNPKDQCNANRARAI
ncbi:MAG: hypothetical protein NTV73_10945 [Hyphomicrobiales bacterium]|nr:hypothetical protein [Hyphomicrobiales bacterium]